MFNYIFKKMVPCQYNYFLENQDSIKNIELKKKIKMMKFIQK